LWAGKTSPGLLFSFESRLEPHNLHKTPVKKCFLFESVKVSISRSRCEDAEWTKGGRGMTITSSSLDLFSAASLDASDASPSFDLFSLASCAQNKEKSAMNVTICVFVGCEPVPRPRDLRRIGNETIYVDSRPFYSGENKKPTWASSSDRLAMQLLMSASTASRCLASSFSLCTRRTIAISETRDPPLQSV
jgi:hypothetical protein